MDVSKPEQRLRKLASADTTRLPLVLTEKNNAALTTRHPRTREVRSRYKSPTPSAPSSPRRCPSPNATRTTATPFSVVQKRAVSAERKRPSTPPPVHDSSTAVPISSRRPSTPPPVYDSATALPISSRRLSTPPPVNDSSTVVPISSRRLSTGRIPESLWPSTMRSLSASFQSDTISSPVSKKEKEKPDSNVSLDRTLRPSSNVAHRQQSETSTLSRMPSPERKRSLLQGKYAPDQSENAKPIDGSRKLSPERKRSLLQGKYEPDQSENAKPADGLWKPGPERKRSLLQGRYAPDPSEIAKPVDGSRKPSPERKRSLIQGKYASDQSENAKAVDGSRKPSPERKRTLQGKYVPDQSENVKPVDGLPSRLIEQHRWPSRIGGKLSSHTSNRSVDPGDKTAKTLSTPVPGIASSPKRTPMSHSSSKPLLKSSSDAARLLSLDEIWSSRSEAISIDDKPQLAPLPARILSASSLDKMILTSGSGPQSPSRPSVSRGASPSRARPSTPPPRGVSPTPRVASPSRIRTSTSLSQFHSSATVLSPTPRVASPSRIRTSTSSSQSHSSTSVLSPTPRGVSPTRMRTSNSSSQSHSSTSVISSAPRGVSPTPKVASPTQIRTSTVSSQSHSSTSVISPPPTGVTPTPRAVSPTRMRTPTASSQSHSSTSVLSFITDFKGRKSSSYIEDAHQLRLLYNRFLQWRFANAHAEAVLYIQKGNVEETLYNVWNTNLNLWDALIKKKIDLQRLKFELKLNSILNDHIGYLNDWALLERDHMSSLAGAVEDLEANTLRLPVTGGAGVDIESLKAAISSAVDVMQAMGSSICSLLPKVEGVNYWVSEYAAIAAQEKNMLDECEALLASTASMQLEEYSLRSHLIQQTKESLKRNKQQPILETKTFPWP